jgi:hypothetical protein
LELAEIEKARQLVSHGKALDAFVERQVPQADGGLLGERAQEFAVARGEAAPVPGDREHRRAAIASVDRQADRSRAASRRFHTSEAAGQRLLHCLEGIVKRRIDSRGDAGSERLAGNRVCA